MGERVGLGDGANAVALALAEGVAVALDDTEAVAEAVAGAEAVAVGDNVADGEAVLDSVGEGVALLAIPCALGSISQRHRTNGQKALAGIARGVRATAHPRLQRAADQSRGPTVLWYYEDISG